MSALTDLFTAMANKIRSKTGTATTYTPSEMVSDGIDDVYDAGVAAGGTSTPITPSNSSPASMTSGTKYTPTANGYAISSYSSMGSSSYPHWLESGDILQSTGEVLALGEDEYGGDILPQNSNPQLLVSGKTISVMGMGYAIESYSNVTPSNSSPVSLFPGSICKMSGTGKAVASVTSKTPSDSSPASVTANSIIQPSAAGYLVKNTPVNLLAPDKIDQANYSSSGSKTITVTQKPRLVIFSHSRYNNSEGRGGVVICDITNQKAIIAKYGGDGYSYDLNETYSNWIGTVSSTSIQIKNPNTVTYRGHVLIYY